MVYKNYTDEEFTEAVASSGSVRQVLIKLDLAPLGGNYTTFKRAASHLELDTSHFHGQAWNKGIKSYRRKVAEYLKNPCPYNVTSYRLKLRLLAEKMFDKKCYVCSRVTWRGKPIPLELEHVDGNSRNNLLENLTLLCPNCHAQTDTYRGKNRK